MNEAEKRRIQETYQKLIEQQKFEEEDLDYSVLERHIPNLKKIVEIGNSNISVFDFNKRQHVFNSFNLGAMLGYSTQEVEKAGEYFFDMKIHPEDYWEMMQNALSILKIFFNFSINERINHKLISEFRIKNSANDYMRVIEQHQVLELDNKGNLWLALSILDISPNQKNMNEGLKSEMLNFRTGKIVPFLSPKEEISITLTKREIEVLRLVKEGLLSKEISDKLSISLHTVNTHRQRFLEKLGVSNSIEAVILASKLGLL